MNIKQMMMIFALMVAPCHALAVSVAKELTYRVQFSGAEDVALLIKKGADPNGVNDVGLPMVSVAAMRSDDSAIPVLRTLVELGADINRGGPNNQYPIMIAVRENNTDMVRYLVHEAKVKLSVRDLNGNLPLEVAEHLNNDEAASLIRDLTLRERQRMKWLRSPQRREELLQKLGKTYCHNHYMHYIYRSGQERHSKEFAEQKRQEFNVELQKQLQELNRYYAIPYEYANVLHNQIGAPMNKDFAAMISNRERKRRGVGTKKDKKQRCDALVGAWYENLKQQESQTQY